MIKITLADGSLLIGRLLHDGSIKAYDADGVSRNIHGLAHMNPRINPDSKILKVSHPDVGSNFYNSPKTFVEAAEKFSRSTVGAERKAWKSVPSAFKVWQTIKYNLESEWTYEYVKINNVIPKI
jgi:hypothetical protein